MKAAQRPRVLSDTTQDLELWRRGPKKHPLFGQYLMALLPELVFHAAMARLLPKRWDTGGGSA